MKNKDILLDEQQYAADNLERLDSSLAVITAVHCLCDHLLPQAWEVSYKENQK